MGRRARGALADTGMDGPNGGQGGVQVAAGEGGAVCWEGRVSPHVSLVLGLVGAASAARQVRLVLAVRARRCVGLGASGLRVDVYVPLAVRFYCTISYDPFRFLALHNKVYGFAITVIDQINTIPSLIPTVLDYLEAKGIKPRDPHMWEFLMRKNGQDYAACHFWTNFEVRVPPLVPSSPLGSDPQILFADRRPALLPLARVPGILPCARPSGRFLYGAGEL